VIQDDGNADGDLHFGGEKLIKFSVPSDLVVAASSEEVHRGSNLSPASEGVRTIVDESITYLQGFLFDATITWRAIPLLAPKIRHLDGRKNVSKSTMKI
jgi:hypothetical protein